MPIEAGITRATCPSMVTVNVCAEMLATPTTAAPVGLSVLKPPSVTVMWLCAGQNPVGFHWNVL